MNILGLDPGFACVGFAVVDLVSTPGQVITMGLVETKKSPKKRNVLAVEDNWRRAREIATELRRLILEHRVVAICAEYMSFPRHASVAAKMAMCWGVLVDIATDFDLPTMQVSPQEVKKRVCGSGSASKQDVECRVREIFKIPRHEFTFDKNDSEHPHDALATVYACQDSEIIRALRRSA